MLLRSACGICGMRPGPVCPACEAGLSSAASLPPPLHLDGCWAALDYASARSLITSLKNGQRRDLVGWLADRVVEHAAPPPGSVVTWAPTSAARRQWRGYDQAELLARATARRWDLRCRPLLRRAATTPQAGRSGQERRANPSFAAAGAPPAAVVLVDDVVTTGATLTAAARALRAAGAATVVGAVVARSASPAAHPSARPGPGDRSPLES